MNTTTRTKVTSLDQLAAGDTVRTSGGRLDYKVQRVSEIVVTAFAFANDGRTLCLVKTRSDLRKGNLFKITYNTEGI